MITGPVSIQSRLSRYVDFHYKDKTVVRNNCSFYHTLLSVTQGSLYHSFSTLFICHYSYAKLLSTQLTSAYCSTKLSKCQPAKLFVLCRCFAKCQPIYSGWGVPWVGLNAICNHHSADQSPVPIGIEIYWSMLGLYSLSCKTSYRERHPVHYRSREISC